MQIIKPIIYYIPDFLDYCREKGLSNSTQENYKRYLKKLITWLEKSNKKTLRPHELTTNDISNYIVYLSSNSNSNNLKKISQNYYLIALRALLSYFSSKDIVCLLADKISLPRVKKTGKDKKQYFDLKQIEELLSLPNTETESGLRDRIILEILIANGLKVTQLVGLDIEKIETISKQALPWAKKYLSTRNDKNKALFINYRARKDADRRLTARSVERIINKYGRLLNLPFFLTPEILRWAHPMALLNKKPESIQQVYTHQISLVKKYEYKSQIDNSFKSFKKEIQRPFSWHFIEDTINKEVNWLKDNIPVLPESYKTNPIFLNCDDCILRKIAILIVNGKVKATEIKTERNKDLWGNFTEDSSIGEEFYHGKEWHRKMMSTIYTYCKLQNLVQFLYINYGIISQL